jgi:hypothetical protein
MIQMHYLLNRKNVAHWFQNIALIVFTHSLCFKLKLLTTIYFFNFSTTLLIDRYLLNEYDEYKLKFTRILV